MYINLTFTAILRTSLCAFLPRNITMKSFCCSPTFNHHSSPCLPLIRSVILAPFHVGRPCFAALGRSIVIIPCLSRCIRVFLMVWGLLPIASSSSSYWGLPPSLFISCNACSWPILLYICSYSIVLFRFDPCFFLLRGCTGSSIRYSFPRRCLF
jgi:hypothetical protein